MRDTSKQSVHERARRLGVRCSWLLAGWVSAASAQAQSQAPGAAPATVGRASPGTSSVATEKVAETREQALALVTAADRAFRGGDPAGSIPLLEEAYRIGGWPGCLLNLAMAHHALSRCEAALEYYRHYLSLDPYTDRRDEVIGALNELEGICGAPRVPNALGAAPARPADGVIFPAGESRAAPAVAAIEPRSAAGPRLSARAPEGIPAPRTLEYVLLGAGALSGVAAVVFTVASQRKEREAERFETFSEGDSRARDIHDAGVLYNRMSWGFGLGAAVLVGSGTTLWLMHAPGSSSIGLGAGSFPSVRYQGRF